MAYYHGAKASKQATTVSTPVTADSSIHFIVGAAPAHTVGGAVNEPILAHSYAEAVQAYCHGQCPGPCKAFDRGKHGGYDLGSRRYGFAV